MRRVFPPILMVLLTAWASAQDRCEVVFLADFLYANNPAWVSRIKTWGATGVNLRIFRSEVESSYRQYDFRFFRGCLRTLAAQGLDIHIRVSMAIVRPSWVDRYTREDFHQTRGGHLIDNYNAAGPGMPLLNITAGRSRGDLLRFFGAVVRELERQPSRVKRHLSVVTPTLGPDDETEYPASVHRASALAREGWWGWLTGYSEPEQHAFVRFLRTKYNGTADDPDAAGINAAWGAMFPVLDRATVRIDEYDWERLRDHYEYFPAGRRDFLEFRAAELKRFLDTCATMVHTAGLRFGVQFAALHDAGIEFRGVWDMAPLVEHADLVISDDVPEHGSSFWFSADYLRTVCRFWSAQRARRGAQARALRFGTETNWPGYNNILPEELVEGWRKQLRDWYDRGGSVLYLSHWGTVDEVISWQGRGPARGARRVADVLLKGGLDGSTSPAGGASYDRWRSALRGFARSRPKEVTASVLIQTDPMVWMTGSLGERERGTPKVTGSLRGYDGSDSASIQRLEYPFVTRLARRISSHTGDSTLAGPVDVFTPFMKAVSPPDSTEYRWIIP